MARFAVALLAAVLAGVPAAAELQTTGGRDAERARMVAEQLEARDIRNPRVLDAMPEGAAPPLRP